MTGGGTEKAARHDYLVLDGMRGVAAIGVLVYHFQDMLPLPLFRAGYLAVDLFFCLSGFVIAHAYEARLRAGMGFGRFALIRFVRLWPLVALGVLLAIAQAWLMPAADPVLRQPVVVPLVLLNLALLPGLVGTSPNLFPVNPPHWSLFYEMAINLAFAAGLVRLSNRWLVALALAGFAVIAAGIAADGHANIGWARDQVGFGLGRVTCTFLAGVLLHRWKGRAGHLGVANGWWLSLLLTALALTLPAGPLRPAYDMAFLLLGAPLLVWLGMVSRAPEGAMPFLKTLGRLSYPLYALHFPLCLAAADLARQMSEARIAISLAAMALACALGLVAARFYDEPFRRRLMARIGK